MVYKHTAKYYRSQVSLPHASTKPNIWPLRKPKPRLYSKNPELNELLKWIFLNNFEEDVTLSGPPRLNFLVFEYSICNGTLAFSLSLNRQMINIVEIDEEKEIIRTFKTLSRNRIPSWVLTIVKRFKCFQLHSLCDTCLSNISVTDHVNSSSVFCLLLKPLTTKKIALTDSDSVTNKVGSPVENPEESHPFLVPIQQSETMTVQEEMIVDPPPPPQNGSVVLPPPRDVELPPPSAYVDLRVDPDKLLEANLIHFLDTRLVSNEVFLFHHDQPGKWVSSLYFVLVEDGKSSIYFMKEVYNVGKSLLYLKDVEKSEISHLKMKEFPKDDRDHLNDYIFLQLKDAMSNSTYFNLQYVWFSLEEGIKYIDVMELNIAYMDGKKYEYVNGVKHELPVDREYFRSKEIARIGDVSLTWYSLLTLSPRTWLNDIIIDSYLNLIVERSKTSSGALPSVYVFNTYFLKRLQAKRVHPGKFSGAHDVLQADLLFMPANIHNVHWALYCVDNRNKTILYYDSAHFAGPDSLELIENFLQNVAERHPDRVQGPLPLKYFKGRGEARTQDNGYDCGLFLLMHADHLSRNQQFNFSQKDMPRFREKAMHELLNRKLSNENSLSPNDLNPMRRIGDISPRLNSLPSLSMSGWLSEKVVNEYLKLIALRSEQYSDIFPPVFVFNTNFLPDLLYEKVQFEKYTAADFLKFDMMFIPFSVDPHNWTLFCVNNRTRTLLCYDSWRSNEELCLRSMDKIEKFLQEVAAVPEYHKGFGKTVQQTKSQDCGFILMYAEYLSRHEEFNFSENEMLAIRTQVLYELHIQKLSSPFPDFRPLGFPEIPSNIEVGCTNDKFQTLNFNMAVADVVIESYMDLLKKCPSVWVYPDRPDKSKSTLLFPFRNEGGWALVAIDRCEKVLRYFNIPTTGEIVDNLRLITLFYRHLEITDFTREELSFSEHVVDSGVYVLAIAYCMALGISISLDNRHIAYLRKKIYWDLQRGSVEESDVASGSKQS